MLIVRKCRMRRNEAKYQAKLKGAHTFFDGSPCKNGHTSDRYTRNSACVQCAKEEFTRRIEWHIEYRRKNQDRINAYKREYAAKHAERLQSFGAAYREKNREKKREYDKVYCAENSSRKSANSKAWYEGNKDRARINARVTQAKRRAKKRQATPSWADHEAIRQIYLNCPPGMEVDHIVPLSGKVVCGLHVEYNLQYLDPVTNRKKSASLLDEHLWHNRHPCNLSE